MPRRTLLVALVALALALVSAPSFAATTTPDPLMPQQWGLTRIGAPEAWSRSTGAGVRIGIVDTGVDLAHEDLAGKVVESTNCIGAAGQASRCKGVGQDDNGHGTHVAGIAAALAGNGKGVAGVAPGAELVVAKVLNSAGAGNDDDVTAGIKWVVDHGAQVVNLSLGDPGMIVTSLVGGTGLLGGSSNSMQEGIDYAWSHGAVPVVAAGNSNLLGLGLEGQSYGNLNAIIVAATSRTDQMTSYSTTTGHAKWAVMAPGGAGNGRESDDILSTFWVRGRPNAYTALAGTSMAAPHVSGAVALLLAEGHTPASAVQTLLATADASAAGAAGPTCRGRINAARAVAQPVPTAAS